MTPSPSIPADTAALVEQSIAAMRGGNKAHAATLLAQAIQLDPNHENAWLWLSGIVATDGERRFCLERVCALNPENRAAQRGLAQLPPAVAAQPPSFAPASAQPTDNLHISRVRRARRTQRPHPLPRPLEGD